MMSVTIKQRNFIRLPTFWFIYPTMNLMIKFKIFRSLTHISIKSLFIYIISRSKFLRISVKARRSSWNNSSITITVISNFGVHRGRNSFQYVITAFLPTITLGVNINFPCFDQIDPLISQRLVDGIIWWKQNMNQFFCNWSLKSLRPSG